MAPRPAWAVSVLGWAWLGTARARLAWAGFGLRAWLGWLLAGLPWLGLIIKLIMLIMAYYGLA